MLAPSISRPSRQVPRGAFVALALGFVAVLALVAGACGGKDTADGTPAAGSEAATAAIDQDAVVIDVRTPAEFDAGHIDGAQLIDIQGPDFTTGIDALDPEQTYVVYCRSGNRSATAAEQMTAAGLVVLDGGGMDDMVDAGWPTV